MLCLSLDKLVVEDHGGEIVTAHGQDDAVGVDRTIPKTELDIIERFIGSQTLEASDYNISVVDGARCSIRAIA